MLPQQARWKNRASVKGVPQNISTSTPGGHSGGLHVEMQAGLELCVAMDQDSELVLQQSPQLLPTCPRSQKHQTTSHPFL